MPLHNELLNLARHLVDRNPVAPVEGDLRRAVSTAYYALFHLLIHESTTRVVAIVAMRPRVARAFDHRDMKKVCENYTDPIDPSGQTNPPEIQRIAAAFTALQQARHEADYDTAIAISNVLANSSVLLAEDAFTDWTAVQTNPSVDGFLTDLLFQSIRKR